MPRRKKQDTVKTFTTEREARLSALRNGRIEKEYLLPLVMQYKALKKLKPRAQMPTELAEVILIIIDKNLGSPSWRRYTADWKEEMRGRAIEHLLKYSHNFDPTRCAEGKDDPYNYFARIATTAFIQSLKKLKVYDEHNVILNHDLLYNDSQVENLDSIDIRVDVLSRTTGFTPTESNIDWGHDL